MQTNTLLQGRDIPTLTRASTGCLTRPGTTELRGEIQLYLVCHSKHEMTPIVFFATNDKFTEHVMANYYLESKKSAIDDTHTRFTKEVLQCFLPNVTTLLVVQRIKELIKPL